MISISLGALLCFPTVFLYLNISLKQKRDREEIDNAPYKRALSEFHQQLNATESWSAGTISGLHKWINNQDKRYQGDMNRKLHAFISDYVMKNKISTNEADIVIINDIAEMPSDSNKISASARAYLRYIDRGLQDVWSPQLFRRSPSEGTSADQLDYVTYLELSMTHCSMQPNSSCYSAFSEEKLYKFQSESIYADYMKDSLSRLRGALGYEIVTIENHCCGF